MKNKKTFTYILIAIICIIFLKQNITYSSYESDTKTEAVKNIAFWNIKVNETLISTEQSKMVNLNNVVWKNTHTRENKVSPGSIGNYKIKLDFTGTEVSVKYEIEIIDKSIDPNKLLTLNSITGPTFIKTSPTTYTSICDLNCIKNDPVKQIQLQVEWINDDNVNDLEKVFTEENNLIINFKAYQYQGEQIIPYGG